MTQTVRWAAERLIEDTKKIKELYGDSHTAACKQVNDILCDFKAHTTPKQERIGYFWEKFQHSSESLTKRLNEIHYNNHLITEYLLKSLGISPLEWEKLFESSGAITIIKKSWEIKDFSFHPNNNIIRNKDTSSVSNQYNHPLLKRMSFEKAYFHHLIILAKGNPNLQLSLIQEYIENVTGKNAYRWNYATEDLRIWASGTSMNEKIIEHILNHAANTSIQDIVKELSCHRSDVLAWIGDEFFCRLIWRPISEWKEQITIIAKEIQRHINENNLWKLC